MICGPTATGKTSLGIKLAKKFKGEIISADSRQVYQGMDIGTGKDVVGVKRSQAGCYSVKGVKIWLLDVVRPNQEFSVAHYVSLARARIRKIWQRKKLPILVGGTGFYISGVIDGLGTLGVKPDWQLRRRLEILPREKLFDELARLDSAKAANMNVSDRKNPRRLVRAIEVAMKGGHQKKTPLEVDEILFIGLKASYQVLYKKIDQRVRKRVRQGVKKEIKNLMKAGYDWQTSVLRSTLGYKQWRPFFEKNIPQKEIIEKWSLAEHGYCRRQMTWFRKNQRIQWFDIKTQKWQDKVVGLVGNWYHGETTRKD